MAGFGLTHDKGLEVGKRHRGGLSITHRAKQEFAPSCKNSAMETMHGAAPAMVTMHGTQSHSLTHSLRHSRPRSARRARHAETTAVRGRVRSRVPAGLTEQNLLRVVARVRGAKDGAESVRDGCDL